MILAATAAEASPETFTRLMDYVAEGFEALGALILVLGVIWSFILAAIAMRRPGSSARPYVVLRQAFGGQLALEKAVRTWAAHDPAARNAVQAIDRRRLDYVENLLRAAGLSPGIARARAQIIYWAFVGFALSDQPLPRARQAAVLDELLRIATR